MGYCTVEDLATRLGLQDLAETARLGVIVDLVTDEIDDVCGRSFTVASAATARRFAPTDPYTLYLPAASEIGDTTDLVVKEDLDSDGVFEVTVPATDYQLEPFVPELVGGPWRRIYRLSGQWPVVTDRRPRVEITARFGWAEVPAAVVEAALVLGAERWKAKDAPMGVLGFGDFGPVRARENPWVMQLLRRYRHPDAHLGVA